MNTENTAEAMPLNTTQPHANGVEFEKGKCVSVIFNPVSGKGNPEARKSRISEALARHGYRCRYLVTTPDEGAQHFARQALNDGVDLIAVSGGDGTVIEVMSALVGRGVPLAVFPAGTGNLLSVNLKLPTEIAAAADVALFGERRKLDLARLVIHDGKADGRDPQYFAILAGAGYDAWVIKDADREAKNRLGMFAYFFSALKNLRRRPTKVDIRLDGADKTFRRRAKSVMIANMGHLQGSLVVIPDAEPDDGLLEVAILKAESLWEWVHLLFNTVLGRLKTDRAVEYHKVRKVEVRLSTAQPIQFDGETTKEKHHAFSVEVVPMAVEVMVPKVAASSLLSS